MAKRRDIFEDDDGISGLGAPDIPDPEPPIRRPAESAVPEVDVREPTEPSERGIYTPEGMIEDAFLTGARRAQRPAEKSLAELVASVMANPVDEPANEPEAAEVQDEPVMEAAMVGGIADDEEAEPRRLKVFALLGVAACVIGAAAFLLTRGGGSETAPGAAGEPPGEAVWRNQMVRRAAPADQVAAEPPPARNRGCGCSDRRSHRTSRGDEGPTAGAYSCAATGATSATTTAPATTTSAARFAYSGRMADGRGRKYQCGSTCDSAHNPVSGVTVFGMWGGLFSGTASCVTDTTGSCGVRTGNILVGADLCRHGVVKGRRHVQWLAEPRS
jgi:hypothetical protein